VISQLGLSSHENATPISILHNSAAHLVGPGRSLGGVVIGYLGVRIFSPLPVAKSILTVGGIPVLIGLVAMASTGEALYAGLKALVCAVKSNSVNGASSSTLVDRSCWQMLGYILKRKKSLLSMRVLHLVFALVSSENASCLRDLRGGFSDLLGDLDIWCVETLEKPEKDSKNSQATDETSPTSDLIKKLTEDPLVESNGADLEKALYEHLLQMLSEDPKHCLEMLREAKIVPKLLRRLSQGTPNQTSILLLLSHLLAHKGNSAAFDLITFGHHILATLPPPDALERENVLTDTVELRNKCLQLLHSLMYAGKAVNIGFCEEFVSRLGFDFVLLFATPNLHSTTLLWSLRLLLLLLTSSGNLKTKFRDGHPHAFAFGRTISVSSGQHRQAGVILPLKKQDSKIGISTDEEGTSGSGLGSGVGNREASSGVSVASITGGLGGKGSKGVGGWARLSLLLAQRCEELRSDSKVEQNSGDKEILPTEVWLILCAMVLGQPCRNVSLKIDGDQVNMLPI